MNFDFSWFTTVQGMLISCGVLLLFAALIVFIVSSIKKKKEKNPLDNSASQGNVAAMPQNGTNDSANSLIAQYNNTPAAPQQSDTPPIGTVTPSPVIENTVPEQPVAPQQVVPAVEPIMPQQVTPTVGPVMSQQVAPTVEPVVPEQVMPAVEPVMPQQVMPTVEPVVPEQVMPTVEPVMPQQVIPTVEPVMPQQMIPTVEPVMPQQVTPTVEPVVPEQVMPTVEPVMPQQVAPAVEPVMPQQVAPAYGEVESMVPEQSVVPQITPATPVAEPAPVIYGGANPSVGNIDFNQNVNHQIYGGANPLDNTQSISVAEVPSVQPVVDNNPTIVQPQPVPFTSNETL